MNMDQAIAHLALLALPVLLAITLHEAAHGYVARMCGDPTAGLLGRISLNPLRHIDPVGTILVPALIYFGSIAAGSSGLLFGWAKPVPVNFGRLRNPKADMFWVAAAGPLANLAMALAWGVLYKVSFGLSESGFGLPLRIMADYGVMVNLVLMVLNLLPLPPLDGGRIVVSLLPMRMALAFSRIEPYGMWVLLALLASGILSAVMGPLVFVARQALGGLLGI